MLNSYNFKSIFKEELNNFISYKRSLGYDYKKEVSRLKYIDNILFNLNLKAKKITKDTFIELTKRNNMQEANYARHYGIIKDFCKFLTFNNYADIYYEEKKFHFINNYKPVIFSDSLKQCLVDYIKELKIKNGSLFKNIQNTKLCKNQLRNYYRKIIHNSGLNDNSHIHDLRHCFANKALNQMLEKGYDENIVIVYLYKYMGHKTISETEYYLHFTDYNKQKIITNNKLLSKNLYEGVNLDNE